MVNYIISEEEKQYLSQYDITQFERPSIAADMAIFSIMEERAQNNFRKLPEKSLKILLIKRGSYPYKGLWALPGGFVRPGESIYETAARELYEETNVQDAYLKLIGIFDEKNRDPRGWIISNTFLALLDGEQYQLRAGSDAWEAKWFSIKLESISEKKEIHGDIAQLETLYNIFFIHEQSGTILNSEIKEYKTFQNYHETTRYEILKDDNLAFDHGKIILYALLNLRAYGNQNFKIVFDLMPEVFTLTQLQNAFEIIQEQKLLTPNFRRKIADYVTETDDSIEGTGHRPAKLFKRNIKAFYK